LQQNVYQRSHKTLNLALSVTKSALQNGKDRAATMEPVGAWAISAQYQRHFSAHTHHLEPFRSFRLLPFLKHRTFLFAFFPAFSCLTS
jgi:hypothetical protein